MNSPKEAAKPLGHQSHYGATLTTYALVSFAAIVTFSLYPGWLFWDSATQWGYAQTLLQKGLPRHLSSYDITSHWPIFLTLIKLPFLALTGELGLFIFIQAIATFLVVKIFLDRLALQYAATLIALWLVILTPFVWNYAVFHSSDTLVAILAMAIISILLKGKLLRSDVALLVVLGAVLFLTRYNAVTSLLFFIGVFCYRCRREELLRAAIVPFVIVSAVVFCVIFYQTTARRSDSINGGLVLRELFASQRFNDPKIEQDIQDMFKKPIKGAFTEECLEVGIWCSPMRNSFKDEAKLPELENIYVRIVRQHPIALITTSATFAFYQLGFASPLPETEVGRRDNVEPFEKTHMEYDGERERAVHLLKASQRFLFGFVGRPYLTITTCLLCAIFILRTKALAGLCAGFFCTYYGPLLIIAPSRDFRYAFPITLICYAVICASLAKLAVMTIQRLKPHNGGQE